MKLSSRLFTWQQIAVYTAIFVGVIVLIQRSFRYVCANWAAFDCPYYWPVSILNIRVPALMDLVIAAIVVLIFFAALRFLEHRQYDLRVSIAAGILLIAGLTLIHGLDVGYYAPVAGDARTGVLVPHSLEGQEYYHDALTIADPVDFLRRYNEIQPTLHSHAHTHPPGAVLTFYLLKELFRDPGLIALIIMIVSTVPTVYFFRKLLLTEVSAETANYMAFLLILLPVVQIYFLATLDALIIALLTATLYLFCFGKGRSSVAAAVGTLSVSFMLTFVSLFILPVLLGFDLVVRRSFKRSAVILAGLAAVYFTIYAFTGYNGFHSFRAASLYENPNGFMLFVDPVNYLFTRIEDVAEILFFLGPFLMILVYRGAKGLKFRPLTVLTALGCVTLLGMYVTGAWRTGETARACGFIYPYLLFPVAHYMEESEAGASERTQLAILVFMQSIAMQTFGNYHW